MVLYTKTNREIVTFSYTKGENEVMSFTDYHFIAHSDTSTPLYEDPDLDECLKTIKDTNFEPIKVEITEDENGVELVTINGKTYKYDELEVCEDYKAIDWASDEELAAIIRGEREFYEETLDELIRRASYIDPNIEEEWQECDGYWEDVAEKAAEILGVEI